MQLHQFENLDTLSQSLADWLIGDIKETLKKKTRYSFVLSGGNTPKALYRLLATHPRKEQIEWSKIEFYIGDERYVPFEDERHNGKMAYDTLLNHIPVKEENIYLMDTSLPQDKAAAQYEELLHQKFDGQKSTFDFVLLGMGGDGHTLSLFPGTEVVQEMDKWVAAPFVEAQKMYRITLTRPVVHKAEKIVFMAAGEGKANALKEVLEGDYNPNHFPSQTISRNNKNVHWFVDTAAASKLTNLEK